MIFADYDYVAKNMHSLCFQMNVSLKSVVTSLHCIFNLHCTLNLLEGIALQFPCFYTLVKIVAFHFILRPTAQFHSLKASLEQNAVVITVLKHVKQMLYSRFGVGWGSIPYVIHQNRRASTHTNLNSGIGFMNAHLYLFLIGNLQIEEPD